jgi:tetratricopeptide (TPR) repeat protein
VGSLDADVKNNLSQRHGESGLSDVKHDRSAPASFGYFAAISPLALRGRECNSLSPSLSSVLPFALALRPPPRRVILRGVRSAKDLRASAWDLGPTKPLIQATTELNQGKTAKALESLNAATAYYGDAWVLCGRGGAYLRAGRSEEARQEFQKVLGLKNLYPASPSMPLAQLGLARAYAMQGDSTRAKAAYQDFLALWKDADPDIPILKQAKAEYAKLQ